MGRERIVVAETDTDYATFAVLIGEYFEWMFARYGELRGFIEAVGGHQGIEDELQNLPAKFGPPARKTLLAWLDGEAAGCVAYKGWPDGSAEMKRLFVAERFQGQGLGRRLAEAIVGQAGADGFSRMKLDTGFLHDEALAMYTSMGFRLCGAYIDYPPELMPHLRFMEMSLSSTRP